MRLSPLAALAVLSITLSACGADRSERAASASPSPQEPPQWSDWVDFDSPMAIFDANDDYAVLGETGVPDLAVHDRSGQRLWQLPEPRDFWPGLPAATIASNDDSVFVLQDDALTALDWATGDEQWRFDLTEFGDCVRPEDVTLLTSRLTQAVGIEATVVLNANAGEGAYEDLPQSCFGEITSDFKDADVLVGLNAKTGAKVWSQRDNLNHKQLDVGLSLDGAFVDRVVTNELPIHLERTDTRTGEKKSVRLMLDEWGYQFPDPVTMSDMGHDQFAIDLGGNGFVTTTVDEWTDDLEAAKSFPPGDFDPCEVDILTSRTAIQYCLEPPNDTGDYRAKLVRGIDGDGRPASSTAPITAQPWTAAGPRDVAHDPETSGPGIYGIDPVAPQAGGDPIVALPGRDDPLQGWDLATGEVAWSFGGKGNAGAEYTSFVPATKEFVTALDGDIVGLDAATGTETWRDSIPYTGVSPMSAKGPFIMVRSEGSGRSILKALEEG